MVAVNPVRRGMLAGLLLLVLAVTAPLVVRWALRPPSAGPAVSIVLPDGRETRLGLAAMKRLPAVERKGEAQNQYGNWRDAGAYTGVLLADLLRRVSYASVEAVAADGYRVIIERERIEDPAYPMVLAYACDGVSVPDWTDGFRIVVLPDDGRVTNEEYRAASAGSYWVKNVVRLIVSTATTTASEAAP